MECVSRKRVHLFRINLNKCSNKFHLPSSNLQISHLSSSAKRRIAARNTRRRDITARSAQRFNHFILSLFFTFIAFSPWSQEKHGVHIGTAWNYQDFQLGLGYSYRPEHWRIEGQLETGVIRTFFQQRFFPRISVTGAYMLALNRGFTFGLGPTYAFSSLKVNAQTADRHQWHEMGLSIRGEVGKNQIRWALRSDFLGTAHRFRNQLTQQHESFWSLGIYIQASIIYCW